MNDFTGVKIALIQNDQLVMILRDDKPGLKWANMWDFPGGGREGDEAPLDCVLREIKEELLIELDPDVVVWQKEVEAMHDAKLRAWFMVAKITTEDVSKMKLGSEGQRFDLMKIDDFFGREDVVPRLKDRLRMYFDDVKGNLA